jgi:S1-C subfamily serine protease
MFISFRRSWTLQQLSLELIPMNRRAFFKLPLFGVFAAAGIAPARAALVPPFFTYCVVGIGGQVSEIRDGRPVNPRWVATGTGFFYGRLSKPDPDLAKRQYDVYLVTAKHVVDQWRTQQAAGPAKGLLFGELMVRVNPIAVTSPAIDVAVNEFKDKDAGWTSNPAGKDVSVLSVNFDILRQRAVAVNFFAEDEMAADVSKLRDLKVAGGDGVFILGFPMGLIENWRNAVIIKSGIIARIEDVLIARSDAFLIDALVFPGNSGGPVVLRPEITSISGTPAQNRSYLIGMVISYQPYIDVGVSQQTQRPRITFEENSGLASVLPTDYIAAAIVADQKKHPPAELPTSSPPPEIPAPVPSGK